MFALTVLLLAPVCVVGGNDGGVGSCTSPVLSLTVSGEGNQRSGAHVRAAECG